MLTACYKNGPARDYYIKAEHQLTKLNVTEKKKSSLNIETNELSVGPMLLMILTYLAMLKSYCNYCFTALIEANVLSLSSCA